MNKVIETSANIFVAIALGLGIDKIINEATQSWIRDRDPLLIQEDKRVTSVRVKNYLKPYKL